MIAGRLTFLAALCCLAPHAQALQTEERIDLPTCTLQLRVIKGSAEAAGPRFIMMDGVPLSGAVFNRLGERLAARLDATSTLIDFPGVGRSTLKGTHYGWNPLRQCLRTYLATQPPHLFILGDMAMPVIAPLLNVSPQIRKLVVLNSVIKPSQLHPAFPLNFLRCCPQLAATIGGIVPDALLENRVRAIGLGHPEQSDPEAVHALTVEMRQNNGLRRLARLMNDIELNEETDRLIRDGLATPIPQLYLWGEADPVLGNEYTVLQPLAAHQRLIVFPQARHFLMIDFADEVVDAIANWHAESP